MTNPTSTETAALTKEWVEDQIKFIGAAKAPMAMVDRELYLNLCRFWLRAHANTASEQPADTGVGAVAWAMLKTSGEFYLVARNREDADFYTREGFIPVPIIPPTAAPPDQDKARNARSVGTGAVTEESIAVALNNWFSGGDGLDFADHLPEHRERMRKVLEDFAVHHAAEGARSGETGDARDAARYRWLRDATTEQWRKVEIKRLGSEYDATNVDAAIDAAIAASSQPTEDDTK